MIPPIVIWCDFHQFLHLSLMILNHQPLMFMPHD